MILVSKLMFGSVAMATLAGSFVFNDAIEAARGAVAAIRWADAAQAPRSDVQPAAAQGAEAILDDAARPPFAPRYCPGRCELWAVLSQMR